MNDRDNEHRDAPEAAIQERAAAVTARLESEAPTFRAAIRSAGAEYEALLDSIATLGPVYAFEKAGRPAAIAAVRQALPVVERDLFDAILDDFACEQAAVEEGLYRIARALARRAPTRSG